MIITKQLKGVRFEYDDDFREFRICEPTGKVGFALNKVYGFAFLRFIVRISQRNWFRKNAKKHN